ncbi:MAG: hypothetical protein JXB18_13160 [Sedimentisphaerales bacterium]|nr:hypothetical protein [Sedimentisphaerales bacterium]
MKIRSVITCAALIPLGIGLWYVGRTAYQGAMTIHQLLTENKQLKQAITNLMTEEQIGYAKVVSQEKTAEGTLMTTLKFVETDRSDKLKKILEKDYTIEGDIVHFDALIVKYGSQMVMDGKARAMYLWRRIYGEAMSPREGFPIEELGQEPARYADLLQLLPAEHRQMFWEHIWELVHDPEALSQYDIKAIYGNAVYTKLRPGLIYVFKITASGQVYPEVVPEL